MSRANRKRAVPTPSRPPARHRRPTGPSDAAAAGSGDSRDLARGFLLVALVLILVGWTFIAWPRLTLPFSSFAPIVHGLDTDVLYDDGVGLTEEQRDGIRGAIGTRPIAMVFLPEDGPNESEVCKAVSPRIPDVQLIIVRGPDGSYGCTGDKVPVINDTDVDDDLRGLAYELRISAALDLVADPVAKAQGAALVHDSMVRSGRLVEQERSLRTPWAQVGVTLLIVAGVLAGVLILLNGLRRLALYLRAKRIRRAEQERIREDLDDALAELALAVVHATPDDPRAAAHDADSAAGYVDLLDRAGTARGGWAGLLREARELLGVNVGTDRGRRG